jgi:lipopolysaccharide export system permease protein
MQFLWKYIDDLVGKGLEISIILKLIFFSAFTFIPMSIPLAILLSGLIAFGNIAEKNELTAMKSSGISLYRIIQPLFILIIGLSVLNFTMSNNIVPVMSLKFRSLLEDIRDKKMALNIEEGVFYRGIDGYTIRIGSKERDNQTIHNVLIYDHTRTTGLATLTYAKHGSMVMSKDKQYLILSLNDGFLYDENTQYDASKPSHTLPILRGTFDVYQIRFDLSSFQMQQTNEEFFKDSYEMLNVNQLNIFIDTLQTEITTAKQETADAILKNFRYISSHYNDSLSYSRADSILQTFKISVEEKQKVYTHAIQTAREHSQLLDFNLVDTESKQKRLWRYEIEWHRKYVLSFACALLFFVGVSLGAILRKGGLGVPLAVSILVFVIYWAISSTGERMARVGSIPSELGMWLSTLILLPLAVLFVYKASTEAGLSDMPILLQRLQSVKDFFTRKKKRKNTP